MSAPIKPLTQNFAVAPQLGPDDMADVAAAGYKSVIINRPDFEGGPDQPTAADVSKAALAAGLQVEYQPVVGSAMTAADVQRFAELPAHAAEPRAGVLPYRHPLRQPVRRLPAAGLTPGLTRVKDAAGSETVNLAGFR